jgi:GT2 family glycosyltransferase
MRASVRIAVLMAVHNRWDFTLGALLKLATSPSDIELCIHIFDDGSTDNTKSELSNYLNVTYLAGSGKNFWAKSMKYAQDSVSEPIDYFLWLNNDVSLADDFFHRILAAIKLFPESVLVGQTSDPWSKQITYGGLKRIGRHPHRLQIINSQEKYESADTFCGNIVLIPNSINKSLGGIDGEYEHGFADYDFGYRAKRMGFDIQIIPGFLGTCSVNAPLLSTLNFFNSLKILTSKKYLPIRSQIRFCKRHAGPEWLIYVLAPYLRAILNAKSFNSIHKYGGF